MRTMLRGMMYLFCACTLTFAQQTGEGTEGSGEEEGSNTVLPGASLGAPDFDARVSVGFNYDFLKDPCRVSFDYPRGYIGLNIPLKYGVDKSITDEITSGMAGYWDQGEEFEPTASAQQNANTTVRVEVPMLRGVGTFSNIQNFFTKYTNTLGEPALTVNPGLDSIDLMLRGMIAVPLEFALGWETMTLGYAYQLNDLFTFAVNLHRHMFRVDMATKIDIDLLGYIGLRLPDELTSAAQQAGEELGGLAEQATQDLLDAIGRQNFQYMLEGEGSGHYDTQQWSVTLAAHAWRFGLTYRSGIDTRAPGYLSAKYVVPFFVNPQTFMSEDLTDPEWLMENMERFLNGETDSIEYRTTNDLVWKMPHALSLSFDIVPEKLFLSYTKFFGEIEMGLDNIATISNDSISFVDFSVGVTVDHIIMVHGAFQNAFVNLGIFAMDFRYGENADLLEKVYPVPFAGGAMLPVLNLGTTMGSKIKLLLELDLLPLSALKTGVIYYF